MPHPGLLHPEPLPLWQATADPYLHRRQSNTQRQVWLSLCGVSRCSQGFVCALWAPLEGMGFDSIGDFTPPTIFLGLLLCSCIYLFLVWSNILLLMVVQQWVVILEFSQKMSTGPSTPASWIVNCYLYYYFKKYVCQPGNQDLQVYYSLYIHCTFHFISRGDIRN